MAAAFCLRTSVKYMFGGNGDFNASQVCIDNFVEERACTMVGEGAKEGARVDNGVDKEIGAANGDGAKERAGTGGVGT